MRWFEAFLRRTASKGQCPSSFTQHRIKKGGSKFTIYKFRTMKIGAAAPQLPQPAGAPAARPARGPAITNNALIGADGSRLPLRRWLPRGAVKAVILALHGFNDYSNAFAMPAALSDCERFPPRGAATLAIRTSLASSSVHSRSIRPLLSPTSSGAPLAIICKAS